MDMLVREEELGPNHVLICECIWKVKAIGPVPAWGEFDNRENFIYNVCNYI